MVTIKFKTKYGGELLNSLQYLINHTNRVSSIKVCTPELSHTFKVTTWGSSGCWEDLMAPGSRLVLPKVSIYKGPEFRVVINYNHEEGFDDLDNDNTYSYREVRFISQIREAMFDTRPISSIEIYGTPEDFILATPKQNTTTTKSYEKEETMNFAQTATKNITDTTKTVVNDALDVATGMAAVEVIKQIAFSIMPVKVGFMARMMGANSWVRDNPFVVLGIVTVVHTILKSSQGRLSVNENVMAVADNALRYATFKAVEAFPIQRMIQELSDKLVNVTK